MFPKDYLDGLTSEGKQTAKKCYADAIIGVHKKYPSLKLYVSRVDLDDEIKALLRNEGIVLHDKDYMIPNQDTGRICVSAMGNGGGKFGGGVLSRGAGSATEEMLYTVCSALIHTSNKRYYTAPLPQINNINVDIREERGSDVLALEDRVSFAGVREAILEPTEDLGDSPLTLLNDILGGGGTSFVQNEEDKRQYTVKWNGSCGSFTDKIGGLTTTYNRLNALSDNGILEITNGAYGDKQLAFILKDATKITMDKLKEVKQNHLGWFESKGCCGARGIS